MLGRHRSQRGHVSPAVLGGLLILAGIATAAVLLSMGVITIPGAKPIKIKAPEGEITVGSANARPAGKLVVTTAAPGAHIFTQVGQQTFLWHGKVDDSKRFELEITVGSYIVHCFRGGRLFSQEVVIVADKPMELVVDLAKVKNEMVYVPAGTFELGSGRGSSDTGEDKPRRVMLGAYYIDRYEVSNLRYRLFTAYITATNDYSGQSPEEVDGEGKLRRGRRPQLNIVNEVKGEEDGCGFNALDQPAVAIDWWAAYHYAQWAGKRLPSECEWEKAAGWDPERKVKTTYPWGSNLERDRCNVENIRGCTKPINAYPNGVSPYGCFNMVGNAAEWVNDWYHPEAYQAMPFENPPGPTLAEVREYILKQWNPRRRGKNETPPAALKVLRGGSGNFGARFKFDRDRFTTYSRVSVHPDLNNLNIGFRCARSATPEEIKREEAKASGK